MKKLILASLCAVLAALAATPAGAAEAEPALSLTSLATPTAFAPGDSEHEHTYDLRLANLGGKATDGSDITVTDTLPAGLTVEGVSMELHSTKPGGKFDYAPEACTSEAAGESQKVTCTISEALFESNEPATLWPGEERRILIHVGVPASMPEGQTLVNAVEAEGGGSAPAAIEAGNETAHKAGGEFQSAPAGLSFFHAGAIGPDGREDGEAGSHPYEFVVGFAANTKLPPPGAEADFVPAGGDLRDIRATLPAGFIGNPTATERCGAQEFSAQRSINLVVPGGGTGFYIANDCPESSAVGFALVQEIEGEAGLIPVPVYNLVPPPGMPAQLGMQILGFPFYLNTEVKPSGGYRVVAGPTNLSQAKRLVAATVVLWGDPAEKSHDRLRGSCLNEVAELFPLSRCEAGFKGEAKPFLRLPTSCRSPLEIAIDVDTWSAVSFGATDSHPAPGGCEALGFSPSLEARPSTEVADSPSGFHVDLRLPQDEDPTHLGTADLRKAVVTLPDGLVLNPSAANGLGSCSEAQIGYLGKAGAEERFSDEPAHCPPDAQVGEVTVHTPLLDHPLEGSVYIATPHANPFGGLAAIYLAVEDPQTGIVVKLAGDVHLDPDTGRITTTFAENPQLPFSEFELDFFGGPAAALRTPPVCGSYASTSEMTPWSAPDSGPPARPADSYEIARSPGGGSCPRSIGDLPNAPEIHARTLTPVAAATSPMVIDLSRPDDSQEFSTVRIEPPPGLLARLAGIPYCPDAALAAAAAKSGHEEQAHPSCPEDSRVGGVQVAAGAGPAPYWTKATAYLTGPYKGAPLSMAIIAPATAGPYDLGTVVVRTALYVDPVSARITAVSDPIPHILEGVPLDVREAIVRLDHPGWALNPTSCDRFSFDGQLISTLGRGAELHSPFQVGECGRLGFKPRLALRLRGKTKRTGFPALHAVYRPRPGQANLKRMVLRFPRSEFIEQGHFRTICTRVQFAAGAGFGSQCPEGSVYGHIRAYTPLLAEPLQGPVFLRSSEHNLPDAVFALHGQIDVEVSVRIDSVKGGLRASIEGAPDAPISRAVIDMRGGQKGLFVNSRNICAHRYRANLKLDAQNGKAFDARPPMRAKCGHKKHRKRHGRHRHRRR